jgi:cytoskeletal protein CcmA (bactofilin family)
MFKVKKQPIHPSTTDTLIGEGTIFEGNFKSVASIRIEGHIRGDIECDGDVVVGEKGVANSNITARDVILAGKVQGNVVTKGKLTITSSGFLVGNTAAAALIIDEGGIFQGTSSMDGHPANLGSTSNESEQDGPGNVCPISNDSSYNDRSVAL